MKQLILKIFALSFVATLAITALDAQPVRIKCGDQSFCIPDFKEDSVQSFNNNEVQNHIIYPIQQSNACIEIRLYTHGNNVTTEGEIRVIKIFSDTALAETYQYRYFANRSLYTPYEFLGKTNSNEFIGRRITKKTVPQGQEIFFDTLLKSNFFSIKDERLF